MTPLIVLIVVLIWLVTLWAISNDVRRRATSMPERIFWLSLTALLGPIVWPVYWLDRHASQPIRSSATPQFVWPDGYPQRRNVLPRHKGGTLPALPPTRMPGSGNYLVVRVGMDCGEQIALPACGAIVVRRGANRECSTTDTLVLHDPSVTRKLHCQVTLQSGQCRLEDHSTYGTIVDGKRIHRGSVALRLGSVIRVGSTTLVFLRQQDLQKNSLP